MNQIRSGTKNIPKINSRCHDGTRYQTVSTKPYSILFLTHTFDKLAWNYNYRLCISLFGTDHNNIINKITNYAKQLDYKQFNEYSLDNFNVICHSLKVSLKIRIKRYNIVTQFHLFRHAFGLINFYHRKWKHITFFFLGSYTFNFTMNDLNCLFLDLLLADYSSCCRTSYDVILTRWLQSDAKM